MSMSTPTTFGRYALPVLMAMGVCLSVAPAVASQLDGILKPAQGQVAAPDREKLSIVRETALREVAIALGARAGLSDRSAELMRLLDQRAAALDIQFNFNPMVIGNSVLPPVISESKDVIALETSAMRVAGAVYRIDEPARFALPTPTWRNWMYVGLGISEVTLPSQAAALPQNAVEQAYWERTVREGYELGRKQAQSVYDLNLSRLERAHSGMRLYFDLWRRGMVSAPTVASSSELVANEGDSTISVGNTLFRITAPSGFTKPDGWTPLE